MNTIRKNREYAERMRNSAQEEADMYDARLRELQDICPHVNRVGYNILTIQKGQEVPTGRLFLKCDDCGKEL